jgi:hypothetical protein
MLPMYFLTNPNLILILYYIWNMFAVFWITLSHEFHRGQI